MEAMQESGIWNLRGRFDACNKMVTTSHSTKKYKLINRQEEYLDFSEKECYDDYHHQFITYHSFL